MLRWLSVSVIVLVMFSTAPRADESNEAMLAGYSLGKYRSAAAMLAGELYFIQGLCDEVQMDQITDENYELGLINDEDIETASLVLAYTIWRVQFVIEPAITSVLDENAVDDPVLEPLVEDTVAICEYLRAATDAFMEVSDFQALALYAAALEEGECALDLMGLAELATDLAGAEE